MFSSGISVLSQGQQGQHNILSDFGLYSISGSMPSPVHDLDLCSTKGEIQPRSLGSVGMFFFWRKESILVCFGPP